MTLFHPATGEVKVEGVRSCPNAILHAWLKEELLAILAQLPPPESTPAPSPLREWAFWYSELTLSPTRPQNLPPLRLLLVLDNLTGHKTPEFVLWCFSHGIALLYTPLGGSWLNMAESIQRILKRRALEGQHPQQPEEIIQWFEEVAAHWNLHPTPFVWKGKRWQRRKRQAWSVLGGSGAFIRRHIYTWETLKKKRRIA